MPKFRKKPVIIEAVQFDGRNFTEILLFMGKDESKVKCSAPPQQMEYDKDIPDEAYYMIIPTLEGDHKAQRNDWIIKGVKGEFYPCKPDIFEQTYEKVG